MTTSPTPATSSAPSVAFPDSGRRVWSAPLHPTRAVALTVGTDAEVVSVGKPGGNIRVFVEHTPPTQTGPSQVLYFVAVRTGSPVPPGQFVGTYAGRGLAVHVYAVDAATALAVNAAADAADAAALGLDPTMLAPAGFTADDADEDAA